MRNKIINYSYSHTYKVYKSGKDTVTINHTLRVMRDEDSETLWIKLKSCEYIIPEEILKTPESLTYLETIKKDREKVKCYTYYYKTNSISTALVLLEEFDQNPISEYDLLRHTSLRDEWVVTEEEINTINWKIK